MAVDNALVDTLFEVIHDPLRPSKDDENGEDLFQGLYLGNCSVANAVK